MEFVLNIYDKKQVVKTYKTESYDLMYGTLEDFLKIIDEEMFADSVSNYDFAKLGLSMAKDCVGEIKPLLMDVFDGLTEEEFRHTKVKEVAAVVIDLAKYSFAEIKGIGSKNV